MAIASCLIDTNILLRISRRPDPQNELIDVALAKWLRSAPFFVSRTRILRNFGMQ